MSIASIVNRLNASSAFVSFNVHSWFACTAVYHVAKYNHQLVLTAVIFAALTALKEYWFDANYEIPKQTFVDSSIDWGSYLFGTVLAIVFALTGT